MMPGNLVKEMRLFPENNESLCQGLQRILSGACLLISIGMFVAGSYDPWLFWTGFSDLLFALALCLLVLSCGVFRPRSIAGMVLAALEIYFYLLPVL